MLTYAHFVDEIRPLRDQIDSLRNEPTLSQSLPFRTWHHTLVTLIRNIRQSGYRYTGCQADGRLFELRNPWANTTDSKHFNSALDDTRMELDIIIANFEKYGDPKPPVPATQPAEDPSGAMKEVSAKFPSLPKPGELTWAWVSSSVPFSYLYVAGTAAVALLGVGFQAGEIWANRQAAASAVPVIPKPTPAAVAPGQAKLSPSVK